MSLGLLHFKLSVDQYEQMISAGILDENDRVELIRGELIEKKSIDDAHIEVVNRLNRKFVQAVKESVTVSVQNPLVLADSEPEPDLALYTRRARGKIRASEVHLVIEVSEASLEFDRTVKQALYAEAGIREYWIVNLSDEQLEVFRQPRMNGTYGQPAVFNVGQTAAPLDFPEVGIQVAELFR